MVDPKIGSSGENSLCNKATQPSTKLNNLPFEIHKFILKSLLTAESPIWLHDISGIVKTWETSLQPSVLRVCKAFHAAGMEVLYDDNTFELMCIRSRRKAPRPVDGGSRIVNTRVVTRVRMHDFDNDLLGPREAAQFAAAFPNLVFFEWEGTLYRNYRTEKQKKDVLTKLDLMEKVLKRWGQMNAKMTRNLGSEEIVASDFVKNKYLEHQLALYGIWDMKKGFPWTSFDLDSLP